MGGAAHGQDVARGDLVGVRVCGRVCVAVGVCGGPGHVCVLVAGTTIGQANACQALFAAHPHLAVTTPAHQRAPAHERPRASRWVGLFYAGYRNGLRRCSVE